MHFLATAPSNIALIKYMGKKDTSSNIPANGSLSYTLPNLISTVQLEPSQTGTDYWEPLALENCKAIELSAAAQNRFLSHLQRIKDYLNYSGYFCVRSNNNFPQASGLASSASSFAALTKCAATAISALTDEPLLSNSMQADFSRQGSGSSCRSFYAPWSLWDKEGAREVSLPYTTLLHQVVVISTEEKEVASSLAHQKVVTSPLYQGRNERAECRLESLIKALVEQNWALSYQICWEEFQDMHHLFETCETPFSYMNAQTKEVLTFVQQFWERYGDGPIATMDAGPNIHLLYRDGQQHIASQFHNEYLLGRFDVL